MRGQALSTTRKLNKHWQSGGGQILPRLWYDAAEIDGDVYVFGIRYMPVNLPQGYAITWEDVTDPTLFNPDSPNGSPGAWKWPDIYDGQYSFDVPGDFGPTTHTVSYKVLSDVYIVPKFSGVEPGDRCTINYHDRDGHVASKILDVLNNETLKTFNLVADIVFCEMSPGGIDVDYEQNIQYFSRFFPSSVIVPQDFNPIWQSTPITDDPIYTIDNFATQQFTYTRQRISDGVTYGPYYIDLTYWPQQYGYGGSSNAGIWHPGTVDDSWTVVIPISPASPPTSIKPLYIGTNYKTLSTAGWAAPFCNILNGYDPANAKQPSAWLRDFHVISDRVKVLLIVLKEIEPATRIIW